MKKLGSILIALLLGLATVFGIAGCSADTQDELQSKIDELQSQIEELEEQLRDRDERIEQLEKELLEKMPEEKESVGTFYTLQEAYDNIFLDRDAIMHISYYLKGSVHDENGTEVDFVPEKTLSELHEKIVDDIKTSYFYLYPKAFQDGDGNFRYGKEILNIKYFGEYNNYYVVIIDSDLWCYGGVEVLSNIGGIVWTFSGAPILVFSYK